MAGGWWVVEEKDDVGGRIESGMAGSVGQATENKAMPKWGKAAKKWSMNGLCDPKCVFGLARDAARG